MRTTCSLLACVSLVAFAVGINADEHFTGDGTAYTLSLPSAGNCNMMSALDLAVTDYAALNNEQWDELHHCGRCAEVSCTDERCLDQSKTVVVQILDRCPECKHGDLDLSPTVFTALTGMTPSRYGIKWKFVDCPVTGNVNYCLKGGSNPFWMAVQPTNVATGVASLQINGHDTVMLDSAYYYVLDGASETETQQTDVTISMTDIYGQSIKDTVTLTADSCTEGSTQFPFSGPHGTPRQPIVAIQGPSLPKIELGTAPVVQVPVVQPTPMPTPVPTQTPTPPSINTSMSDGRTPEKEEAEPTGSAPVHEVTDDTLAVPPVDTVNTSTPLIVASLEVNSPYTPAPPVMTGSNSTLAEQEEIKPTGSTPPSMPMVPVMTVSDSTSVEQEETQPTGSTPTVMTDSYSTSAKEEEIKITDSTPPSIPTSPVTTGAGNISAEQEAIQSSNLTPTPMPMPPVTTTSNTMLAEQEDTKPTGSTPPSMPKPPVKTGSDNTSAAQEETKPTISTPPSMPMPHIIPGGINSGNVPVKQEELQPTRSTPVSEVTAPLLPVLPVATYAPPVTPRYAIVSPVAAPAPAAPITTPLETFRHPVAPQLRTKPESEFTSTDSNAIKPTQQLAIGVGLVGIPSPGKTPMSTTGDGILSIATDSDGLQQPSRGTSGLPLATPVSPSTITERTAEDHAADNSGTTRMVNTQSSMGSGGTDPLVIVLSTLGAVAMVALIAMVVVAKRKKIEEQKMRDVEMPSMISVQSCEEQHSPTDTRSVFVAH